MSTATVVEASMAKAVWRATLVAKMGVMPGAIVLPVRAAKVVNEVISSSKMMSIVILTDAASTVIIIAAIGTIAALATTRAMESMSRWA